MSDNTLYPRRVNIGQSQQPGQKPPAQREWSVGSFTSTTLSAMSKPTATQILPARAYDHASKPAAETAPPQVFQAPVAPAPVPLTEEEAYNLAVYEPITGTYNFNYVTSRLKEELVRTFYCKRNLSVMVVSIINLPHIGISCGALALEEVAKMGAELIFQNCRPIDMVGNFKEGRFIVVCPEMDAQEAIQYASNICEAAKTLEIQRQFEKAPVEICVGIYQIAADVQLQELTTTLAIADVCADLAADQGPYQYFIQPQ